MAKTEKKSWKPTRLKEWRDWKGWTLAELAHMMDYNEGALSDVERGVRRYNQDVLEKAASVIGVPVSFLIDKRPPPKGQSLDFSDPRLLEYFADDLPKEEWDALLSKLVNRHKPK